MIEVRDAGGVRVLRLAHGKANLLDTELLAALDEALERATTDETCGIVLTGRGRVFSAGVDLFRVLDGGREYLERFLPDLSETIVRLLSFPKPVVGAINGHAIAGGCILACACDLRIGVSGDGRIGVTELRVGVPFPAAAFEVVRAAVRRDRLREAVLTSTTYLPPEAQAIGFLDHLADPDSLIPRAIDEARRLAAVGAEAFAFSKRQLRRATLASIHRERDRTDSEVLGLWDHPATRQRIRSYVEDTLGRRS